MHTCMYTYIHVYEKLPMVLVNYNVVHVVEKKFIEVPTVIIVQIRVHVGRRGIIVQST